NRIRWQVDFGSYAVLVVGGGLAGLRAAIAAVEANPRVRVGLVSKVYPMRSHTVSAEGGAAAALRPEDSYENHAFDTVKGSDYLADRTWSKPLSARRRWRSSRWSTGAVHGAGTLTARSRPGRLEA